MSAWFDSPRMLAPAHAVRTELGNGAFTLASPEPLGPYARCTGEWVEHWATETPDAVVLAERAPGGDWRQLSWRSLRQQIGAVGQALLDRQLPPGDPVVVLSDNSIDHALLVLAALHIGRPVCSVSSAYSRAAHDHTKIAAILKALGPALVFASDGAVYGPAIAAGALPAGVPVVLGSRAASVPGASCFSELTRTRETPAVVRAFHAIAPDDHAKYLLTSGSTGRPKVVINTHRMLCANQQMILQAWRFLAHEKPVLLDWLPWSHTFGANHNLNLVLRHGGTLFIDDGRPAPGLVERTVANLRDVQPTLLFNVPRGLDLLLPFLEADDALARRAMGRLKMIFYAGAALPESTWRRLEAVAARVMEQPLWLTTSWGSTETSPAVTSAHWRLDGAGNIGLPLPGMELKFVPVNGAGTGNRADAKMELRVRGVSVFPGYRNAPELTRAAFDDEGYYRIGDAGRLADAARPEAGVLFDGRVAEDFKLSSGTWVSVGSVRLKLLTALAPYAQDAVITGHDRDEVGALVFRSAACAALDPVALDVLVAGRLAALQGDGSGSSSRVARVRWLTEPADADAGEITDKGYLNQRAVLARRDADVVALHGGAPGTLFPTPSPPGDIR